MQIPILSNHDYQLPPVGRATWDGDRLKIVLFESARVTKRGLFEVFGNAGVRVLKTREVNGVEYVAEIVVLEFSVGPEAIG